MTRMLKNSKQPTGCSEDTITGGEKMAKKNQRITLYKRIWCKVRYWQSLRDITDAELASYLQVGERTLREYDKSAKHITLEKVDNLLYVTGMELNDLMTL